MNGWGGLQPWRPVQFRIFDGTHEVLRRKDLMRVVNIESPALDGILAGVLAEAVEMASVLENERMDHPRLEMWCAQSGRKLRDYFGGLV
ncbi:hypothetical protein [Winogradskya humida]|nr:hypothetical protein [Actinoplanes humidus]